VIACSRSSLVPDETALATTDDAGIVMEDSGLGTKGDDGGGVGTKDSGVGTKDAGVGTKDSGLPTKDSGSAGDDSGSVGDDSGTGEDGGSTGEDAGVGNDAGSGNDGGMTDGGTTNPCLACAEQKCAVQTNLCLDSPACVTEGACELACLTAGKNVFATNRCIESCVKNFQANLELFSAVSCGLTLCPQECLPIFTSVGVP
jgi:hypothetical protein